MTVRVYLHSFIAVVGSQICEITRNSEKIRAGQFKVSNRSTYVSNRKHIICNFLLVINSNSGHTRDIDA